MIKQILESHMNPSRKKISFCNHKKSMSQVNQQNFLLLDNEKTYDDGLIFNKNIEYNNVKNSTNNSELRNLRSENQQFKKQILKLEAMNQKLINKLVQKDSQLTKVNTQYKNLLLKYNQQLSKFNANLSKQIQPSNNIQQNLTFNKPNYFFQQDLFTKSQYSKPSNTQTKHSLLKLKQSFDKLDFRQIQRIAKHRSSITIDNKLP